MELQRPHLTASWGFIWDQRFDVGQPSVGRVPFLGHFFLGKSWENQGKVSTNIGDLRITFWHTHLKRIGC